MKIFDRLFRRKSHAQWLEENPGKHTMPLPPATTEEDLRRSREKMESDIAEQKERRARSNE